jgi:hypothetical protein
VKLRGFCPRRPNLVKLLPAARNYRPKIAEIRYRRGRINGGRNLHGPEGEFDFPGYTFGRMYSARTGKVRLGQRRSKKSIKRMVERVHALTNRR